LPPLSVHRSSSGIHPILFQKRILLWN